MTSISLGEWAQDLVDRLTAHMDSERDVLTSYRELVETSDDPRVRELAMQILDDEIRHHRHFDELRTSLREEIEQRLPPVPRVRIAEDRRDELRARTAELLEIEKDDVKELRQLAKRLRSVEDTAWRAGALEAMELDNRKHILLLEQIQQLLR